LGSCRHRSWSFSRQELFKTCPRAFFYNYLPWGHEFQDVLVFLKNSSTLEQMVGTVAHETIAMGLDHYRRSGFAYKDLSKRAVINLGNKLKQSYVGANAVKQGKRPRTDDPVLLHHLEKGPSQVLENAARTALEKQIKAFHNSSALKFLFKTERGRWMTIDTGGTSLPNVIASPKLGFPDSVNGLRVYTPYDIAAKHTRFFTIIDWKTGRKTDAAIQRAKRQTCSYAFKAIDKGYELKNIRVHPFWLIEGEEWDPQTISQEEMDEVVEDIRIQDEIEKELLVFQTLEDGRQGYFGNEEDFVPKPGFACKNCKFKTFCPEGRKVTESALKLCSSR
jgi:hypothetical protein